MAHSQNGWPVITDRAKLVNDGALGVKFPNGWLAGDVDVIFSDLITKLNRIQKIMNPGCWGWFVKNIEGSTTISNHASGTAIDYNAPAHAMGVRNTYSAADRAAIRSVLAYYEGTVRWGGDYTGRPDDMHFEINAGAADVADVAAKIRKDNTPLMAHPTDALDGLVISEVKYGDNDADFSGYDAVLRLQLLLRIQDSDITTDGVYGPQTREAVKGWMARAGDTAHTGLHVGVAEWRIFVGMWPAPATAR